MRDVVANATTQLSDVPRRLHQPGRPYNAAYSTGVGRFFLYYNHEKRKDFQPQIVE